MQGGSESMLLGSPPGPLQQQSPYLPAYLMGDSFSTAASPASRPWSSPPRSHLNRSVAGLNASTTSPAFLNRSESVRSRDTSRFKDRPGAPPVHGLIESVSGPLALPSRLQDELNRSAQTDVVCSPLSHTSGFQPHTPGRFGSSTAGVQMFDQSYRSVASPAQVDPFYTQGDSIGVDEHLDETWVTIFGFPPAATSFILQEFSQYGNIVKHVVAADGNWLHIHYQSKLQAKKALSKNGKVFGGSIMIGVAPCIDKTVMDADKENTNSFLRPGFQSPLVSAGPDETGFHTGGKPASLRPLTSSFKVATSDTEVLPPTTGMPQRNSSMITKAMEYMFGW